MWRSMRGTPRNRPAGNGDKIQLFVPGAPLFGHYRSRKPVSSLPGARRSGPQRRRDIGRARVGRCLDVAQVPGTGGNVHGPGAQARDRASAVCHPTPGYTVPDMDWKIELVAIPVTDVDRAKAFYVEQAGFHADHDYQVSDVLRFVQLTPPGSACSIVLGTGVTQMPPGSQKGVQCVVADVEAARRELIAHGVQASDVDVQPWGSFVTFSDPDGNTWALQQVPPRP